MDLIARSALVPQVGGSSAGVPFVSTGTWVRLTMIKETSGTVVFGNTQDLFPISSGAGMQLPTGTPVELIIPPGTKLYLGSDSSASERVSYCLQPLPEWLAILKSLGEMIVCGLRDYIGGGR